MCLSVCIIAKNEERNIGECLECLKPYGFEIIVVDTGSVDRTKEIAARYTDKLFDFEWCDDFAAAKNFAIAQATTPYVLVIDSDEFVEHMDAPLLYQLIERYPNQVGRIRRKNVFTRKGEQKINTEWINRIFATNRFHYEGRIHEQVMALDGTEYETYHAPIEIRHTGYDLDEAQRRKKAERNIILLNREIAWLQEQPEDKTQQLPYLYYQLGKSYYMEEEYGRACEFFSQGLSYDLNPKLEYVIDMVETYGYALINSGQAETALFFENIYDTFGNNADFLFLMGLIYMNNARFEDAVAEFLKAAEYKEARTQGANDYLAYYNIGVIYECLGDIEKALKYYGMCGSYEPACRRYRENSK